MKATLTAYDGAETCSLFIGNSSQYAIISAKEFTVHPNKVCGQFSITALSDDASIFVSLYVDEIDDQRTK